MESGGNLIYNYGRENGKEKPDMKRKIFFVIAIVLLWWICLAGFEYRSRPGLQ